MAEEDKIQFNYFCQEVIKRKDALTDNASVNQDGLFELKNDALENYFLDVFLLIHKYIQKNGLKVIRFSEKSNPFEFKKLEASFKVDVLEQKLRTHPFGPEAINQITKMGRVLYRLSFIDCKINELNLSTIPGKMLSQILVCDCSIKNLNIHNVDETFIPSNTAFLFSDCEINHLRFHSPTCSQYMVFKRVNIKEYLDSFGKVNFHKGFNFEKCTFCKKGRQKDFYFAKISFQADEFSGPVAFTDCDFYISPKFHQSKFYSGVSFLKSRFHEIDKEDNVEDYRILKTLMLGIGAEQDCHKFHALEMDARRKTSLPKISNIFSPEWPAAVSSNILKIFNDYGRNYLAPFAWLFVIALLATPYSLAFGGFECSKDISEQLWLANYCSGNEVENFKLAFFNTLYSLLGPVGFLLSDELIIAKNQLVELFSFGVSVLSTIIWYLIIVQFRRQFKL